jgi:serine/threonine-protein kinase
MDAPQTLGKYDILDLLGAGGMGTVYRARDRVLQRVVALKVLHPAPTPSPGSEDHRLRFLNEARAVARLNHPNIVSLFDFSDADPTRTFLAMEYVEGCTVADLVEESATVRLGCAVPLLRQLLHGLDFAHGQGVIHRDIKPSNLLVTEDHRLKIGDFGVAMMGSDRQTRTGYMVGTPTYMAPERYRGDQLDARCDVYSAAVVLHELLTGRQLFVGSLTEIIYQICHVDPEPASRLEPAVPALLDPVLAKGLAKDPTARYQTAGEFAAAIAAVTKALTAGPRPVPHTSASGASASDAASPVLNLGSAPTVLVTKRVLRSDSTPSPGADAAERTGPPGGWTSDTLAEIERHLTPIVGPMSRIMIKRAARVTQDWDTLCAELGKHLQSEEERKRFLNGVGRAPKSGPVAAPSAASGLAPAVTQPPSLIPQQVQDRATQVMLHFIGPIATVLVKKAATTSSDEADFHRRLAERISDERERARCLTELMRSG